MKHIIQSFFCIALFAPLTVLAEDNLQQTLFNQLKQNIEKSCQSQDFLNCVNINNDTCQTVSSDQLKQVSSLIESNAEALAQGQFTDLLKQIKVIRNNVLETNGIEVAKANACGKEFLAG